jgi:hypothetical protein
MKISFFSNQSGSALAYLLMGIAMMGGISVLVTDSMNKIGSANNYTQSRLEQKSSHMGTIALLKTSEVRDAFLKKPANSALYQCLLGQGTNCNSLNGNPIDMDNAEINVGGNLSTINFSETLEGAHCSNKELCKTVKTTKIYPVCSSEIRCENIKIKVNTKVEGIENTLNRELENEMVFAYSPTKTNFNRANYSCSSSGNFLTEISFKEMKAICGGLDHDFSCSSSRPIQSIDFGASSSSCHSFNTTSSCPNGFAQLNIMSGNKTCIP